MHRDKIFTHHLRVDSNSISWPLTRNLNSSWRRAGCGIRLRLRSITSFGVFLLLTSFAIVVCGQTPQSRDDKIARADALLIEGIELAHKESSDSVNQALPKLEEALRLYQQTGLTEYVAHSAFYLGKANYSLGRRNASLDYFNQALRLWRELGDKGKEASTLNNIGAVYSLYSDVGDRQKALDYFKQALPLYRVADDKRGEASALNNIGDVYLSLSENQQALDYFKQALLLLKSIGYTHGEIMTLSNIGLMYVYLGEKQKALDHYEQALLLSRSTGDRYGEAMTLNNLGLAYINSEESQKAIGYFNQALPLLKAIGNREAEAAALNNIGTAYLASDEAQKALTYLNPALEIRRDIGDKSGEANSLNNIGRAYSDLGDEQTAAVYYQKSWLLLKLVGDRGREAGTLSNLMFVCQSLGNRRAAIFYGKLAVNALQSLRGASQGLDNETQKSFVRSVQDSYRKLAELLVEEGQLESAVEVLNFYQDQQFFDFNRDPHAPVMQLAFSPPEDQFAQRYKSETDAAGRLNSQIGELRKRVRHQSDEPEAAELARLESALKIASGKFLTIFDDVAEKFAESSGGQDAAPLVKEVRDFQQTLRTISLETKQHTVALYTLMGETNFHLLLVSPDGSIKSFASPITPRDFDKKVVRFHALLQSDGYDPRFVGKELYDIILKPAEAELKKQNAQTLLWSLSRKLRYVPMSALWDGERYLVERYQNVVFTRTDSGRIMQVASPTWTGYGFGASKPHQVEFRGGSIEFKQLDFGNEEMRLFRTKTQPHGLIDGDIFSEAAFTRQSLLAALRQGRPLIHISSHFRFYPGDDARSFLLLGDGEVMTLAEMKEYPNLFQGVELLTLSACDTATQLPDANGREVDGFAELAQRLGASSVMASLWQVRDRSTAKLMKGFYKNRQNKRLNKAEALRRSQLELLRGDGEPASLRNSVMNPKSSDTQGDETTHRGASADNIVLDAKDRILFEKDKSKPFAHPYYWSPFVLFGNWK